MPQATARRLAGLITLLSPGLYAARLLSEFLQPGLFPAILLTLLISAGLAYLLHRLAPARPLWLALPLYGYVFYPHLHHGVALAAASAGLISLLLNRADRLPRRLRTLSPRLSATLVFVLSLALYVLTTAPGVLPADNGELQLVAARLGVAHPPGFALYTVLAHLATRLPIGATAAFRANVLSAFIAAATLTLVFLSAHRLTRSQAASLIAVAALATATTFWSQATMANVRMLTAFFAALAIYLLLLYRDYLEIFHHERTVAGERSAAPTAHLFLFALTLALGVSHHASFAFMALIFALALLWLDPTLLRRPARWAWPAAALLLGLLPLLYFPLRGLAAAAGQPVRGASPRLATLPGFLEHVLALGFRGDLFAYTGPHELWPRLQVMANVMTFQFHWLLLAGMLLGFLLLLRAQPKTALALGGAFVLHTLVTAAYRAPQTVEYMLPAYVPAALLLSSAAALPLASAAAPAQANRALSSLLAAVLLVVALAQGLQRYPSFAQLSHERVARAFAAAIMEQAPQNSVVLADWHWATPLWYLQEVEDRRPDLQIHYVFPTAEPYAETWARRIATNLQEGHPVVATHFDAAAYGELLPPEPLGDAFLFRRQPRAALPDGYTTLDEMLADQIELLGYRLQGEPFAPLGEAVLSLAWRPTVANPPGVTLFAHLVSPHDGAIYAQQDTPAQPAPSGITLTQLRFTPRLAAAPGDYDLYVGAYESANGNPLLATDGATRIQLQTVPLQPIERPPYTANPIFMSLISAERQLAGYDWDYTLAPRTRLYLHWRTAEGYVTETVDDPAPDAQLPPIPAPWGVTRRRPDDHSAAPQYYVPLGAGITWTGAPQLAGQNIPPGATVTLAQHFAAGRPTQQDLVVSARLIGYEPDGVHWAWWDLHDAIPALGAIPTLKWIDGSHIRDPHFLTVSPAAPSGQSLGALVTLYDAFTQRPLPILDERITEQHLGIPLGTGSVR